MTFRIVDWKKHYETSETRKVKRLAWVPVPNHQGRGYARLVARHGAAGLGVWVAILQIASRVHQSKRTGLLEHSEEDIAICSRLCPEIVSATIQTLLENGWLQRVTTAPGEPPGDTRTTSGRSPAEGREGRKEGPPGPAGDSPGRLPADDSGGGSLSPGSRPEASAVLRKAYGVQTQSLLGRCVGAIPDSISDGDAARWLAEQRPRFTTALVACRELAQAARASPPQMESFEDRERREAVAKGLTLDGYRLVCRNEITYEEAKQKHPAGYSTREEHA